MIGDRIEREIRIEAPIDVVWSVVSEPAQICQWFVDIIDFEFAPGAEGKFRFVNDHKPASYNVRIERLEPPHHLAFRWAYPDGVEADETNAPLVEFSLNAESDAVTRLTLVESGLRGLSWDEEEKERYYTSHREGWVEKLAQLEKHIVSPVST